MATGPRANVNTELKHWLEELLRACDSLDLNLARYVTSSGKTVELGALPQAQKHDLFPCPPPFSWHCHEMYEVGCSRRKADRFRKRRVCELWTNFMIVALSHHASGLSVAPLRGREGAPLNGAQVEMRDLCLKMTKSIVRLTQAEGGCGLRLPAAGERLQSLREQLGDLFNLPYARPKGQFQETKSQDGFAATKALPVVAERLSLPSEVKDFDPSPYLSELFKAIYEDPDQFLKPPEDMPKAVRARGTATRKELLKVFQRWDALGRLYVCDAKEVSVEDRCEIFAVAKDDNKDRQILHRRKRNQRERHFAGASRDLPHGVLLTQLPLEQDFVCVCSVDDIKDFYHAYVASEARARSSPVGPLFRWEEVAHFEASKSAKQAGRIRPDSKVACCFQGLGMGDHAAVDIAQESHVNLLKAFGGMKTEESLNYRKPLPIPVSGYYEGVMIDDHLGVQLLKRKANLKATLQQTGRDMAAFEAASTAYAATNLEAHPGKRVRRSLHCKVWGAELEGDHGLAGPVRARLLRLAQLTAALVQCGVADQKVLEAVLGLWAYCAQFRRPMFSFMYEVYRQHPPENPTAHFKLTKGARNELLTLAILAPLCISDLRVVPDSWLYCIDASPSGAGVCRAPVGASVIRELWRRGDKLGFRSPMLSRFDGYLREKGLDEDLLDFEDEDLCKGEPDDTKNYWFVSSFDKQYEHKVKQECLIGNPFIQRPIFEEPFDFLEIYTGGTDMSQIWVKTGARVLPPIDGSSTWNLEDAGLFWGILGFLKAGKVRSLWVAFQSVIIFPALDNTIRSPKSQNSGCLRLENLKENMHGGQALLLAMVQLESGNFMTGEQSADDFLRNTHAWSWLKDIFGLFEIFFDWCQFGRFSYKPTAVLLTNVETLKQVGKRCDHLQEHHQLENHKSAYPNQFCEIVVGLLCEFVGRPHFNHQDFGEDFDTKTVWDGGALCSNTEGSWQRDKVRQKGGSHLWAVQLSESLPWKTWIQYSFRTHEHINLQETKARRSLIKRLSRNKRVVLAQDSRVNLGSLGKGRSPSESLNRLMRSEAPYILGKNLYLASVHFPTWSIRADCPSRSCKVAPPRSAIPAWFWLLKAGDTQAGHWLDELEGLPRCYNRWFVLASHLLLFSRHNSPAPASAVGPDPGVARTRSHHRKDQNPATLSVGPAKQLARREPPRVHAGRPGPLSHRQFVRMVGRIHDSFVSRWPYATDCSRDAECGGPEVWMVTYRSCRALEPSSNLGVSGAEPSSLSNSSTSHVCPCGYCVGLGLAQDSGPFGSWLFWFVETLRAYRSAEIRLSLAYGSLGRTCGVHQGGNAQNPVQSCQRPTCADRRALHRTVDHQDPDLDPLVESYLARILSCFQNPVQSAPD